MFYDMEKHINNYCKVLQDGIAAKELEEDAFTPWKEKVSDQPR